MNVDEAMEAAASYPGLVPLFQAEVVAITLAKEVERLRGEVESVIRLGPHPVEQVQMPLATFVRSRFVSRWDYDLVVEKLEKAQTELAEAKAELDELVNKTIKRNGWGAE